MENLSYKIHTFGCKVNTYDSGLLEGRLNSAGFQSAGEPRIHILNSCAVTAEATKEAIRCARRLKVKDPFCKVIVTGCAAQVDTDKFENLSGIDLVVANSHKGKLESLVRGLFNGTTTERVYKSNIFRKEDLEAGGGLEEDHTRSFLKIQDGCNSFCTFCVIPFARGKSRSIPTNELVKRVRELHDRGIQEIVLTGVHIGDYEDDSPAAGRPAAGDIKRLEDLIESLLKFTEIPRIRLSSLEPIELTPRLLELFNDERMCPHFHMSIQSANTKVLSDMKRKYSAREVEWALETIHAQFPDAFVGMDVIAGFPGETDEEFLDTYTRLAKLPWTRLHVFPYSPRPGTKATKIENQLERSEIKDRAKALSQLSRERFMKMAHNQLGRSKSILGLKAANSLELQTNHGLSRDYWRVQVDGHMMVGSEVAVKVIGHAGFESLEGSPYLTAEIL